MAKTKSKPLLELSTLRERKRWILIDKKDYTLHDPASMGVQQQAIVIHAATTFREMGANATGKKFSLEDTERVIDLLIDATTQVTDAPREVVEKLTIPQMLQVIDVFTSSAGMASPPTQKPKSRGTGVKSSQPSKGSTAEG